MDPYQSAALVALLIIAFITDVKSQIIPNRLTASFFLSACLYQAAAYGMQGLAAAAAGAAAGFIPLLALHLCRGIGAGDVKLFAAIGAWSGIWPVLSLIFYSILFAGAIGICLLLANRPYGKKVAAEAAALAVPVAGWRRRQWLQWANSGKRFPFMLAVAPAAVAVWASIN